MLWNLLIDASLSVRSSLLGRLLRWIDRSRLIMREQDARDEEAVARTLDSSVSQQAHDVRPRSPAVG
jgi:hypothetical protein